MKEEQSFQLAIRGISGVSSSSTPPLPLYSQNRRPFHLSASMRNFLLLLLTVSTLTSPSTSATDSFVYGGCSELKYAQGSPDELKVDSLLTSLVNSAKYTTYNNFTFQGSSQQDTIYGLFQCRGDLSNIDCGHCVASAVSQIGTLCRDSIGGTLHLEGCVVKYDKIAFLGVEDKTVVVQKCGPSISSDSDAVLGRRDAVLGNLTAGNGTNKPYRVSGSGDVQGIAQCVQDLTSGQCQDCLLEAVGQLKTRCGSARWGDMYLAKCYVRYSEGGDHSDGNQCKAVSPLRMVVLGLWLLVFFHSNIEG